MELGCRNEVVMNHNNEVVKNVGEAISHNDDRNDRDTEQTLEAENDIQELRRLIDINTQNDSVDEKSAIDHEMGIQVIPEEQSIKLIPKVLEIPIIKDCINKIVSLTGPCVGRAKMASTPMIHLMTPLVEAVMNKIEDNQSSKAAKERLIDCAVSVDNAATVYVDHLIDSYPAINTPTLEIVDTFTVSTLNINKGFLN